MKKLIFFTLLLLLSFLLNNNSILGFISPEKNDLKTNGLCISPIVVTWGGVSLDWGESIALDSKENIILLGYTESFGGHHICLIKYDSYLNYLWNVTIEGGKYDTPRELVIDDDDNIYAINTIWEGPTEDNKTSNIQIMKFNPDGGQLWNRTWESLEYEEPYCAALDSNNDIVIIGSTTSSQGTIFLLKYTSSGDLDWNNTYGEFSQTFVYDMKINTTDEIFITGCVEYPYMKELLVAKFNATGSLLWNKTLGSLGTEDIGKGIIIDNDDIYVTGQTGSLATYLVDTILIKYNATGYMQWYKTWNAENVESITLRPDGNIIIAGNLGTSIGIFLVEYSPTGYLRWNTTWIGGNSDFGKEVCAGEDNLYLIGKTNSFGNGDYDILLLTFQPVIIITPPPTTITIPIDDSDQINIKIDFFGKVFGWLIFAILLLLLIIAIIFLIMYLLNRKGIVREKKEPPKTITNTIVKERVIKKEGSPGPEKKPEDEPLTLESDIDDAPEVGPAANRQFKRLGIKKVKDFMNKSPEEVVSLLKARGYSRLSVDDIKRMQTEAQLMLDIPKLRVHDSVILFKTGVKSKSALTKSNPEDLWTNVKGVLKDQHVRKFIRWSNLEPTKEEMNDWISWTKE